MYAVFMLVVLVTSGCGAWYCSISYFQKMKMSEKCLDNNNNNTNTNISINITPTEVNIVGSRIGANHSMGVVDISADMVLPYRSNFLQTANFLKI